MQQAKKRVIIVGAGIAGISAAIHIANNREEAIVVESKPYWGGRHVLLPKKAATKSLITDSICAWDAIHHFFLCLVP